MAREKTSDDVIEQIKAAPRTESHEAVAKRLGVSVPTVRKYRKAAREERQEVAREILARHVEENIPDALQDLTDLRRQARNTYEESGDHRDGTLWLHAIKTTLDHVKPDDGELDREIERELAKLADCGEAEAP